MFRFRPQLTPLEGRANPGALSGGVVMGDYGAHPGHYAEIDHTGGVWVGPSVNRSKGEESPSQSQAVIPQSAQDPVADHIGEEIPQRSPELLRGRGSTEEIPQDSRSE